MTPSIAPSDSYKKAPLGPGRYSPPKVPEVEKRPIFGKPVEELVSTSYAERMNLNVRMTGRARSPDLPVLSSWKRPHQGGKVVALYRSISTLERSKSTDSRVLAL
jgi:hypothetical protein